MGRADARSAPTQAVRGAEDGGGGIAWRRGGGSIRKERANKNPAGLRPFDSRKALASLGCARDKQGKQEQVTALLNQAGVGQTLLSVHRGGGGDGDMGRADARSAPTQAVRGAEDGGGIAWRRGGGRQACLRSEKDRR